jgi:hypothetical protein
MSVGGMIGGVFNGIIAPNVFQSGVWEFHIAIIIACFVRPEYVPSGWFDELIMNAAPGLRNWAKTQGDEMAKSMGRPQPGTTYMFNYFLDVVMGLFILGLAYFLSSTDISTRIWRWLIKIVGSQEWSMMVRNAWLYLLPMVFCFFFAGRPVRLGLALSGLLVANLYLAERGDEPLEARRTYFGVLRIMAGPRPSDRYEPSDKEEQNDMILKAVIRNGERYPPEFKFTYLMHGTTYHGRNYTYTKQDQKDGYIRDVTRVATTYYHRYGPVGIVFEQYNWFPGKQNTFYADARLPVSLIGQIPATLGTGTLPLAAIVEPWSEPPYATIGLGTGTMASYSRPFQYMTYYEIDDVIRNFSVPDPTEDVMSKPGVEPNDFDMVGPYRYGTRFTYLQNAIWRGVNLEVVMGDARLSLSKQREPENIDNSYLFAADFKKGFKDSKDQRYYMGAPFDNVPRYRDEKFLARSPNREKFYQAIVVDAFSSDAIPLHLITQQAIELYLSKIRDDGVLLVHTSNRHMDLVRPVARIVMELNKEAVKQAEKDLEDPEKVSEADLRRIWAGMYPDEAKDPKKFNDARVKEAKEEYVKSKGVNCRVGKDGDKGKYLGHFSSEYVMVYRGERFTKWLDTLKDKRDKLGNNPPAPAESILNSVVTWYNPLEGFQEPGFRRVPAVTVRDPLWTDDYSNILSVLRW